MGSLTGFELATELDYEEFLECIGRCGLLKYELIEQMKPADRVTALILNVLSRMDVPSVMTAATLVRAPNSFSAQHDSARLPDESTGEHEQWLRTWRSIETSLADLHGFPMWLKVRAPPRITLLLGKHARHARPCTRADRSPLFPPLVLQDVHNTLHSGLQELSACFTRIATRGGEFELDFPAWQSFVRSAATRMQEVASQEDATEVAAIVFGMAASSIGGVAKLNFPAFLAVSGCAAQARAKRAASVRACTRRARDGGAWVSDLAWRRSIVFFFWRTCVPESCAARAAASPAPAAPAFANPTVVPVLCRLVGSTSVGLRAVQPALWTDRCSSSRPARAIHASEARALGACQPPRHDRGARRNAGVCEPARERRRGRAAWRLVAKITATHGAWHVHGWQRVRGQARGGKPGMDAMMNDGTESDVCLEEGARCALRAGAYFQLLVDTSIASRVWRRV